MSDGDLDLDWLAMRYVLGEFSESDRDAFEVRMADDLAACEAVANAAQLRWRLQQAIGAPESSPITHLHRNLETSGRAVSGRGSLLAVGTAITALACLFVGVVFWPQISLEPRLTRDTSSFNSNDRDAEAESAMQLLSHWHSGQIELEPSENEDDTFELSDDVVIPAWLIAGVSLDQSDASDGHSDLRGN